MDTRVRVAASAPEGSWPELGSALTQRDEAASITHSHHPSNPGCCQNRRADAPSRVAELRKNPVDGFSAGLVDDDNVYEWEVTIFG